MSLHLVQIASWVAQASFKPLGLTIAVAKDRAIESLMQARPQLAVVRIVWGRLGCKAPCARTGWQKYKQGMLLGLLSSACCGPCMCKHNNALSPSRRLAIRLC